MAKVLDHGYVELIETWGSDQRIIESARMSTAKGFLGWGPLAECRTCGISAHFPQLTTNGCVLGGKHQFVGDEGLLSYLWKNKHYTPFEMAGMTIEVQAPIMVFRQWHRHRTQSYNEMSGRYTVLPELFWLPSLSRLQNSKQAKTNKQSSEAGFTTAEAAEFQAGIQGCYEYSRKYYEYMISRGVAQEVARIVLPVAQYSKMRASANLRNWLGFLSLRFDKHAQLEARLYAQEVHALITTAFPRTTSLFNESLGS